MEESSCLLFTSTPANVAELAAKLRRGELVAFPTETVYGLGANAHDDAACRRIYAYKRRPLSDPLIVHVVSAAVARSLCILSPAQTALFDALARRFWPGPLTLIVPAGPGLAEVVSAGSGWVGLRVPAHSTAQALLAAAEVPVAAPSANLFAHVSPTTAAHVAADFADRALAVLDGGAATLGIESTVLRVEDNRLCCLRLGSLPLEDLQTFLRLEPGLSSVKCETVTRWAEEGAAVQAPGQFLKHYAPTIEAKVLARSGEHPRLEPAALARCVLVDFAARRAELRSRVARYVTLSETGSLTEAMAQLYALLREVENTPGAELILLPDLAGETGPEAKFAAVVEDKIIRACSGQKITLAPES